MRAFADPPRTLRTRSRGEWIVKKVRPVLGGGLAAREPGLGTGRGGDVTEFA